VTDPSSQQTAPAPAGAPVPGRPAPARTRLIAAALAGLAAVAVAIGLAVAFNDPVGEGGRDAVPAMPDPVAGLNPGTEAGLPPLALILDRPAPDGIGELPARDQVERLTALATPSAPARRSVELGAVLQSLGRNDEARAAYAEARRRDPDDLGARIGLILVGAASGDEAAMTAADVRLSALERAFPDEQLASFNRAWLAIYRADAATATEGLRRTLALDDQSPLGATAETLLRALGMPRAPAGP
jgi:tetratricopeptide (TPR) repeat protein